jgi:hypothetical protein
MNVVRYFCLQLLGFSTFSQAIKKRLNKNIFGVLEGSILYTQNYMNMHKRILRGTLAAISQPTPIATIKSKFAISSDLFDSE